MRKLPVIFLFCLAMLIYCLCACKQKPTQINFTHQFLNEKDAVKYIFKIINNSNDNLFFLAPNLYINKDGCKTYFYIEDKVNAEGWGCNESTVTPGVGNSGRFFQLIKAPEVNQELSDSLQIKADSVWNDLIRILSQADTINLHLKGIIFVQKKSSVQYEFIYNNNLPVGSYNISAMSPEIHLNERVIKKWHNINKELERINKVYDYHFTETGLPNNQKLVFKVSE